MFSSRWLPSMFLYARVRVANIVQLRMKGELNVSEVLEKCP
jgi:hypothetical protein